MLIQKILFWLLPLKFHGRLNRLILGYRLLSKQKSYLVIKGFTESVLEKGIPENHNNIHPWMCYPLVEFLTGCINRELHVFEYGSGFSTIYFANKVKTITSVEHNIAWLDKLKNTLLEYKNAKLYFVEENEQYPNTIFLAGTNKSYDVIVVDGKMRVECVRKSFQFLSPKGVIILDDSERRKYEPAFRFLFEKGYKHITFSGMKPGMIGKSQGSVFYKSGNNCFKI